MDRKVQALPGVMLGIYLLCLGGSAAAAQPDAETSGNQVGILLIAHGGPPEWNRHVEDAVDELRAACPVVVAFGMAQRESLEEAVRRLEQQGVDRMAVVRLFVSPESFRHQTEYLLRLRPDPPEPYLLHDSDSHHGPHDERGVTFLPGSEAPPPVTLESRVALNRDGLYDAESIGRIMVERALSLSRSPQNESVLVLAHGEGDDDLNRHWMAKLARLAQAVGEAARFRDVKVETLREDWHDKRAESEKRIRSFVEMANRDGGRVIVVPFRVFGFGPYAEALQGLDYVSDGRGLLPHPLVTEWIKGQAIDCFRRLGARDPFAAVASDSR